MKKYILFVLMATCIFSFVETKAQSSGSFVSQYSLTLDTITNTGSKTLTAPVAGGNYLYCSVSITAVNISGTSTGTAIVQHSADGTNYYTNVGDTINYVAGTKGLIWTGYRDKKIRLVVTGAGTQSTKISAAFSMR